MNLKKEQKITASVATITALICVFSLSWWFSHDPTSDLIIHGPDMDNSPTAEELAANMQLVTIGELHSVYDGTPGIWPGEWTIFRGNAADNISTENVQLANSWPESGPPVVWDLELGEGHAGAAIKNGRVYVLDYDEEDKADLLRCFSMDNGEEIWRSGYHVKIKRNHGISRTVPAVTDDYVVTIGPKCHVMCVTADSGKYVWGLDMVRDYGTKIPGWYTGQCPYIAGDSVAVIAPAGPDVLIMGVNLADGQIMWQTPNPKHWEMSHVCVMPMTLGGKRMAVYSAVGGMVGISLEPGEEGTVLWETKLWTHSVLAPSPLIMPDGRIFLTAGYGAGSMVIKINSADGVYTAEALQEYKPNDGMACEQQTPLFWNDHFFSIQPKDAAGLRQEFVCYNPNDCTRLIWSSGETQRFGLGPFMIADDKFFILNDDGVLTMAEASTRSFKKLAQAHVIPDGIDAWAPFAIAGGRMILRDATRMICLDLRAQ
ncbi:PQQ-like beta-propeller repeat protein [bacterium]|nr:PQQ-like beta-propeller repeat protein [bacterium]